MTGQISSTATSTAPTQRQDLEEDCGPNPLLDYDYDSLKGADTRTILDSGFEKWLLAIAKNLYDLCSPSSVVRERVSSVKSNGCNLEICKLYKQPRAGTVTASA